MVTLWSPEFILFCQISGCADNIQYLLRHLGNDLADSEIEADHHSKAGSFLQQSLDLLISDLRPHHQETMNVIGMTDDTGNLPEEWFEVEEMLKDTPDCRILVQSCYIDDPSNWMEQTVRHLGHADNERRTICLGSNLIAHNPSLDIMHLATGGRLTPQRFWRLAMACGLSGDAINNIDYGKMELPGAYNFQDPVVIPGMLMDRDDVAELEKMGDIEKIKNTLVHRGRLWVWMSPDRFPLESTSHSEKQPVLIMAPKRGRSLTILEMFPPEILALIASNITHATDILSLCTTSTHLRSKLLGTVSNRNAIARAWIHANAPWYIPGTNQIKTSLSWAYLRRCLQSGSMRNRRRIWRVVQQMENRAGEMGL